jgi:antitoxin MazE
MRIQLIQIGNSKGFRLPKKIIDQYQIQDEMELILNEQDHAQALEKIREGWNEAFQQMHANGDDQLLIDDINPFH